MQISSGAKNSNFSFAAAKASEGKAAPAKTFDKVLSASADESKRSPDENSEQTNNESDAQEENLNSKTEIVKQTKAQSKTEKQEAAVSEKTPRLALTVKAATVKAAPEIVEQAEAPVVAAEGTEHRAAWNDFLGKMNALGVSAEKVLKAFSSLSPKELAQPPEMNIDKMVMALGLNPAQAQQAKAIFTELLVKTQPENFAQDVKTPEPKSPSPRLDQLAQLDQQRMTRDFTRKPLPTKEVAEKVVEAPVAEVEQDDEQDDETPVVDTAAFKPIKDDAPTLTPKATPSTPAAQTAPKAAALNRLVEKMQPVKAEDAKAIEEVVKNAPKQAAARAENVAAPAMLEQSAPAELTAPTAPATPVPALNALLTKLNMTSTDKKSSEQEDGQSQSDVGQGLSSEIAQATGGTKTEFHGHLNSAASPMAAQAAPQVMTIPELVQNAQVMLRDGGGDMKVTLKQEGLGEVAMKISVDSGKVNVQMITQTDEAKKLLEHTVNDLKSSLSAHMQVESIKIDTTQNLKTQLENQGRDAQRQQTQAQWEQFRQDTGGGWKRNYFDTGSLGGAYPGQGRGPRDIAAPQASAQGNSRRLNLVA